MKFLLLSFIFISVLFADKYYIINNPVYTNIYSVKNKIPEIGIVHLTWGVVRQKIKRTNYFHTNKLISKKYQASNKNYVHAGLDKGHFSASNADWDNNKTDMYYTFSFTNMTPQYPKTNRVSYRRVEDYGRKITKKYKSVFVINIAIPSNKYLKNKINIPSMYYKIFMYNNKKECYKIPNNNKIYSLNEMKIKCSTIEINTDF